MNALKAFREGLPAIAAGESSARPEPAPMTESSEAASDIVMQFPLPVAPPSGAPALIAPDGTRLVAGLSWETASGPEAPVIGRNAPPVLRLPSRRARLPEGEARGDGTCGSLLLAMADALVRNHPASAGAWAFMAELPRDADGDRNPGCAFWLGLADIDAPDDEDATEDARSEITPRPGPEQVFDEPGDALDALGDRLAVTDLAGLAVAWSPDGRLTERGRLIQALAHVAPDITLHDLDPTRPSGLSAAEEGSLAATPVFVAPRRVPVRLLGLLGAGTAAALAVGLVVVPLIEEAFRAPPPPPPEMVTVAVAPGSFAEACTAALDGWWPRVTGWRTGSSGCALAGHLPEGHAISAPMAEGPARPMVAWRSLVPVSGRNAALADAAAEQAIATWAHEAEMDETGVTFQRTASLPLVPTDAEREVADPAATRAWLAALWADTPDAVTAPEGTGSGQFTISAPGGLPTAEILSRADVVPGIAPVRLVRTDDGAGGSVLVLAPVNPRDVPVAFLESADGGEAE